jgi:Matrixin/Putative peptidoglycan binding domain
MKIEGGPERPTEPLSLGTFHRHVHFLKRYLRKFGYYEPCYCQDELYCKEVKEAIEKYQIFFGLKVTGVLDQQTLHQMRKPRCGNTDISPDEDVRKRVNDYCTNGVWPMTNLQYFFETGTSDISGTQEWDICRQALDKWAAVTPLTFTETAVEADAQIRIAWRGGDHGDGFPFDGEGNVLAHGFYPPPNPEPIAGDIHFDSGEEWDTEDGGFWWWKRRDLMTVAVHEAGHALGLCHSTVEGSVMWPSYEGELRTLQPDDIAGIQALYGPPVVTATTRFAEASMWALKNGGGYGTVAIDLGRRQRFLAWATVTMIDALNDFDSDNAVVAEVFQVDGAETWKAVFGGAHWGPAGDTANVHQGAYVGYGQRVTFRIRSIHHDDLDAYGMGTVMTLD